RASSDLRREFTAFGFKLRTREKMKTGDECAFENQNTQRKADQRDRAAGRDWKADVTRAEHRPQQNSDGDNREHNKDRHRPRRDAPLRIAPHKKTENSAPEHADQQLTDHGRSDAKLFEMIVTADASHDRKERTRLDENRKAIADDREWRRDAEQRENQHHDGHCDSSDKSGE